MKVPENHVYKTFRVIQYDYKETDISSSSRGYKMVISDRNGRDYFALWKHKFWFLTSNILYIIFLKKFYTFQLRLEAMLKPRISIRCVCDVDVWEYLNRKQNKSNFAQWTVQQWLWNREQLFSHRETLLLTRIYVPLLLVPCPNSRLSRDGPNVWN